MSFPSISQPTSSANLTSSNYSRSDLQQLRLLPAAIHQIKHHNHNLQWFQREAPIWPYIPSDEESQKLTHEQLEKEIDSKKTIQIKNITYVISKWKENESFVAYAIHSHERLDFSTLINCKLYQHNVSSNEYVIVRPSHLVNPKYMSDSIKKLAHFFKTLGQEQGNPIMAHPDTFYDPANPNNGGFSIVPKAMIENINH